MKKRSLFVAPYLFLLMFCMFFFGKTTVKKLHIHMNQ